MLRNLDLRVPTLFVHGLFDQEDNFGGIAAYQALASREANRGRVFLAIGPWNHGQAQREASSLGPISWHSDTGRWFRENELLAFWNQHLRGQAPERPIPPVLAFETGANQWRNYASWPQTGATTQLYLAPQGRVSFNLPNRNGSQYVEYVSDPAHPVPYRTRPVLAMYDDSSSWNRWLVDDQRPFSDRTDVVTFVSEPLTEPMTIAGPVIANLFASTTGTDADWVVKLIDVYPPEMRETPALGGYQLMVSGDIMRGRYRERPSEARPITPGTPLDYRVRLPNASHTFRPGHRIMVQIQSSWFPLYDRNPQTFVANIARPDRGLSRRHPAHLVRAEPGELHRAAGGQRGNRAVRPWCDVRSVIPFHADDAKAELSLPHNHSHGGHDSHVHGDHHHGHGHGHAHHHHPADFGRAFAVGIALNLGFVAVEGIYGFLANSMALLADAGHNLSDVLGLAVAWFGANLAKRPPSRRFSWSPCRLDPRRARQFGDPPDRGVVHHLPRGHAADHSDFVEGGTVTIVASDRHRHQRRHRPDVARGRRSDLNIRGAYLHMVADALVSAGVVIAGIAIQLTGWLWVDPVTGLVVAALIFLAGVDLFRHALIMALAGVPPGIDPDEVEAHLLALPGVVRIHDLHIWPMSTTEVAMTVHLVIPAGFPGDAFLADCAHGIEHRFRISHSTFQVEIGGDCVRQAPHDL